MLAVPTAFLSLVFAAAPGGGQGDEAGQGFTVDARIPGGNILVEKMDGPTVWLRQELRDTARDWFYWHFRVRGAAGKTLQFRFTRRNVFGVRGPAISTDGGKTWDWLGREAIQDNSFGYRFAALAPDVRFAFAIPYLEHDLQAFLARFRGHPHLEVTSLGPSRKGRNVELLRAGRLDGQPTYRVLLTARHHACETMASYVLEGFLTVVLAESADGAWFRQQVEVLVVPFLDKDGVEEGDQGKLRAPHDHWEDYAGVGIYPEVQALRRFVPGWSAGRLRLALDIHCPSRLDQIIYFADPRRPEAVRQLARLAAELEALPELALPFRAADTLRFDRGWNTAAYYGPRKCFALWAEELPGVWAAGTLEVPYAQVGDCVVTAATSRAFGAGLARAVRRFLERAR